MKNAIICFTRIPIPGQTKTRLMPLLGGDRCAALHTAFLQDISAVCSAVETDLFVAHTPDGDPAPLQTIFPRAVLFPQQGGDLGARMDHALTHVLRRGYDACVLIGADLPLLSAEHLRSAFIALETADMTLGPTSDGGYYLIGLRRPCAAVFQNQQYSTASVFENTLAAAKASGLSCATAPLCDDVDTPEDLRLLREQLRESRGHTAAFLRDLIASGVKL